MFETNSSNSAGEYGNSEIFELFPATATSMFRGDGCTSSFLETKDKKSRMCYQKMENFFQQFGGFEERDEISLKAQSDFCIYLNHFRKRVSDDVLRRIRSLLNKMKRLQTFQSAEDCSILIQKFYEDFENRVFHHSVYKNFTLDIISDIIEEVERYLSSILYPFVFGSCPFSEDESADILLNTRIRSLQWITNDMLDCRLDESNCRDELFMTKAICFLAKMNNYRFPDIKLKCIVECSKILLRALHHQKNSGIVAVESNNTEGDFSVNADALLPAFIYIILRGNPPRLLTNQRFIHRYANPKRLISGESAYYFTYLCCALDFIQNADYKHLSLNVQEFNSYMRNGSDTVRTSSLSVVAKNFAKGILDVSLISSSISTADGALILCANAKLMSAWLTRFKENIEICPSASLFAVSPSSSSSSLSSKLSSPPPSSRTLSQSSNENMETLINLNENFEKSQHNFHLNMSLVEDHGRSPNHIRDGRDLNVFDEIPLKLPEPLQPNRLQ